jgi:pimeloyl-ACP methyl ester carboxylesterase
MVSEATLLRGFEERFAEIRGIRTRYFVGGDGPPLVLVHGLGGAAVNFTLLGPLLAERHRVLIPDLPGHARSEPLEQVEGLDDYAEHVAEVAELEGMLPAAVLGYSMGGVVVLRLAVTRPDDVQALVLGLWGAVDPPALPPESVIGFLEGPSQHTDVGAAGRALVRDDPRPDLERVRCPVLLVWGARDRLVPLADGFEYARRLRAPIRVLPAAGHLIVGERPQECAAVVGDYLDRVRKVDELPLDAELVRQLGGERADA